MWFKLNTTFTQSLGTLSELSNSWSITRNLTNYTTTSTVTSVAKNGTYSATFTLNSGCTYSSHSVTMGGATVSSASTASATAYKYDSSTHTITFSNFKVTGALVITAVATGASSGGSGGTVTPTNYTFTINPTPTSATVTLSATGYSTVSGTGSKSITVANGTKVYWSVSASGYTTRTGNWTISGGNKTESIKLVASSGGESGIINYFNPDDPDINTEQYMNNNGTMVSGGTTLGWSGYIACSPGETYYAYYNKDGTYTKYPKSMVTFFDASKKRISGANVEDYVIPEGAAYFKAPFSMARRYNDFMFIKSPNIPTEFIPYNAG